MELTMKAQNGRFASFLKEIMRRRKKSPYQLAGDLGVNHTTIGRWLLSMTIPNPYSCRRLSDYSGVSLEKILSIVGHMPEIAEATPAAWPEFREYASKKYPEELDEDLIIMIEDLIERRRHERYHRKVAPILNDVIGSSEHSGDKSFKLVSQQSKRY
jgi:transcriptional regulator with XRE-family HTH domain